MEVLEALRQAGPPPTIDGESRHKAVDMPYCNSSLALTAAESAFVPAGSVDLKSALALPDFKDGGCVGVEFF